MAAEGKQEFVFIWKFRHLQEIYSPELTEINSPSFEVEFLKEIEWNLVLHKRRKKLLCYIVREGYGELPELIPIDYQYELTSSEGDVLKTSDIVRHTFRKCDCSNEYELIRLDGRNMPESVCLRCRMVIPCLRPSMKSIPRSIVGWLVETDIVDATYPFELYLEFSDSNKWTVIEKVTMENIPIDITFIYVNDKLKMELFPKIEDKKLHTVVCTMDINSEKSETVDSEFDIFEFSSTRKVYQFLSFFSKRLLGKANCFTLKKLNVKVVFDYKYNSLISEIKSNNGVCTTVKENDLTPNKDETCSLMYLQQHLRSMLNEKICADVRLHADGEILFAHKCLLCARSPVFKAMFDQDMLECKTNSIDIHDVEVKILKYFLEYLYTGTVQDMNDEIALSLLVVADKYQVSHLSEMCSTFLKSVLNIDNVLDVLQVADMVNQEQLKVFVIDYTVENSTQVLSSPNWPQWVKTNSTIASEVLLKLSNKFDSSSKRNAV